MLNALSFSANQAAADRAAGTVPAATALTVSAAGTSSPGSWNLSAISLPDARSRRCVSPRAASPKIGMEPGYVLATSRATGCSATVGAAAPVAMTPRHAANAARTALRMSSCPLAGAGGQDVVVAPRTTASHKSLKARLTKAVVCLVLGAARLSGWLDRHASDAKPGD